MPMKTTAASAVSQIVSLATRLIRRRGGGGQYGGRGSPRHIAFWLSLPPPVLHLSRWAGTVAKGCTLRNLDAHDSSSSSGSGLLGHKHSGSASPYPPIGSFDLDVRASVPHSG
jgi:hypothetical protein